MLRLKNIRINDAFAEADYYPETSEVPGHIVVNLSTEEVETLEEAKGYSDMHPAHALVALLRMAKNKDESTEKTVRWY